MNVRNSTDNKPGIRFAGYTDAWEKRKLSEFTSTFSGGTPSASNKDFYGGAIPFIRSSEINSEEAELSLTQLGYDSSSAKMVSEGDILYALYGATSGEVGISRINGAINQAILAIIPHDNVDSQFLMQWLRAQKEKITSKYLQGGQGNLSGQIIKNLYIQLPSLDEQLQIGQELLELDNLITVNQRKGEKLQELKKALLQKMFVSENNDIPEIRFSGYTDAWEKRKLEDVTSVIMGSSPSSKNYTDNPRDYVLVQGNADIKNGYVYPRVWTTQITKTANAGDLILSVRAPVGEISKTRYNVVLGRGVAGIQGNEFLFQNLKYINENKYWIKVSSGSTFDSINSYDVKSLPLFIPSIEEQTQIGDLFQKLDNLITVNQRKVEKLQELKKALLQKMFV